MILARGPMKGESTYLDVRDYPTYSIDNTEDRDRCQASQSYKVDICMSSKQIVTYSVRQARMLIYQRIMTLSHIAFWRSLSGSSILTL